MMHLLDGSPNATVAYVWSAGQGVRAPREPLKPGASFMPAPYSWVWGSPMGFVLDPGVHRRVSYAPMPPSLPYMGGWGADAPAAATDDPWAKFLTYLPFAKSVSEGAVTSYVKATDTERALAQVQAQIQNTKRKLQDTALLMIPGVKISLLDQLNKLQADEAVLKRQLAEQQAAGSSVPTWNLLGQASVGTVILAGVALTTLLAVAAFKLGKG